uniref:phosphoribosylaminoimidazolesuccinocarboxamide synthase n=1 Tax=Staphylococcus hominis TaxID=1290 RepID=UPI0037097D10
LHIANDQQINTLEDMPKNINKLLIQLINQIHLRLVHFKVQFPKTQNAHILLPHQISPHTSPISHKYSHTNFHKHLYTNHTPSLIHTYQTFFDKFDELK